MWLWWKRWWVECTMVALFILSLAAAYLIAQAFPYGNFLYYYQSLITGLLAVAAAFITIRQMMRSDHKQDLRHREILAFGMRGELRRMDHGLHPQLEELEELANSLEQINFNIVRDGDGDPLYRWLCEVALPLRMVVVQFNQVVERPAIVKASEDFNGSLSVIYAEARRAGADVERWLQRHMDAHNVTAETIHDFNRYENEEWEEIGRFRVGHMLLFPAVFKRLVLELDLAAKELETLKARLAF